MNIDSARALKAELTGDVGDTGFGQALAVLGTAGVEHDGSILKVRPRKGRKLAPPAGVALGITPSRTKGGHRLAIRVQRPTAAAHQYAAYAAGLARNEAEIQFVGMITAAPPAPRAQGKRVSPLQPGCSIGHVKNTAGTLGGFVRDARERLGILSNNHVLADTNLGMKGDPILQPSPADGGGKTDVIAKLERFVRLSRTVNSVDAAWAVLVPSARVDGRYGSAKLRAVMPADRITSELEVWKIGRTTGLTHGTITAIELDGVQVQYGNTIFSFNGQFEVVGATGAFSKPGDSGSVIVGPDNAGVGLLFSGSDTGGPKNTGRTYANPLEAALSVLGLDLAVDV